MHAAPYVWRGCVRLESTQPFGQEAPFKLLSSSDPHPDPLFWHSFWHTIWKSVFLAYTLTFYLASNLTYFLAYILKFFLAFYLAYLLSFFLAFYLVYLRRFFVVEVRKGTLRSSTCSWAPAGNALIQRAVAVRVRRGPLRSRACSWGPVGNTLILGLLFGSGGERCNLALAVEVRQRRRRRSGRREAGGTADIKSNNPHLTGGKNSRHRLTSIDHLKELFLFVSKHA